MIGFILLTLFGIALFSSLLLTMYEEVKGAYYEEY